MIVGAVRSRNGDVERLLRETEFDLATALEPDSYIALELETRLWDLAAELTADEAFGIHAAEGVKPGAFGLLDYIVRSAGTVRASLERLARYNRIVHDAAVFTLKESGTQVRVEHDLGGVPQSRHAAEVTLATLVVIARQTTSDDFSPRRVEFRHARPSSVAEAEARRVFRVEPVYASNVNALEFESVELDRVIQSADPNLSRVVAFHAEAALAARPEPYASIGHRVRRLLMAALSDTPAEATLSRVAAELHMSERTLQRHLADDGSSFDALLDETRNELALRYLSDEKFAIAEIAYLLGYSEPSAFHRAFKRWTGKTPAQVRERAA
jgi:AraC-like DNA-binding protein